MATYDVELLRQRLHYFSGDYECHITTDISSAALPAFEQWCSQHGAKVVAIKLANGIHQFQPMLCKQYVDQTPEQVANDIDTICSTMAQFYPITRVKIEGRISNCNVPTTEDTAHGMPNDCYFEHHIKCKLENDVATDILRDQLKQYDGHLSFNALNKSGQHQNRFITQRFYGVSEQMAVDKLHQLLTYLESQHYTVVKTIREYNIFDSKVSLDQGWMD